MNKLFTVSLLAGLFLAGCSDAPKDAPIEERMGAGAVIPTAGAGGSAGGAAGGPGEQGGVGTQPGSGTQAGMSLGGMETHALPGAPGTGMEGTGIGTGQSGAGKNPLKDPGSILAKRVIYFDFDSFAIRDEFRPVIEAHAQYIKDNKQARTILQGHTDERGSRDYNIALGQRRADSVNQAMLLLGVPDAQTEAVSLGEEKPIAEGHDEAAWQQNRRVEIHYQGE
jgi:peptidoglycan-associated lipoprotein